MNSPLLSLSRRAIARSLTRQSIQAILLEKMGFVFVIRKKSGDRFLYKSFGIQK
ncbi:MAG: hypothetical protein KME50_01080 [Nostoc desertorum CM1-VF14]|nr:hypothetical protein [Nostoc desertorum CM1-VF14]